MTSQKAKYSSLLSDAAEMRNNKQRAAILNVIKIHQACKAQNNDFFYCPSIKAIHVCFVRVKKQHPKYN